MFISSPQAFRWLLLAKAFWFGTTVCIESPNLHNHKGWHSTFVIIIIMTLVELLPISCTISIVETWSWSWSWSWWSTENLHIFLGIFKFLKCDDYQLTDCTKVYIRNCLIFLLSWICQKFFHLWRLTLTLSENRITHWPCICVIFVMSPIYCIHFLYLLI